MAYSINSQQLETADQDRFMGYSSIFYGKDYMRPFVWVRFKLNGSDFLIDELSSDSKKMRYITSFEMTCGDNAGRFTATFQICDNTGELRSIFKLWASHQQVCTTCSNGTANFAYIEFQFGWADGDGNIVSRSGVHGGFLSSIDCTYALNLHQYTIICNDLLVPMSSNKIDNTDTPTTKKTTQARIDSLMPNSAQYIDITYGDGNNPSTAPKNEEYDWSSSSGMTLNDTVENDMRRAKSENGNPLMARVSMVGDGKNKLNISEVPQELLKSRSLLYDGPIPINYFDKQNLVGGDNPKGIISFAPKLGTNWWVVGHTIAEKSSAKDRTVYTTENNNAGQFHAPLDPDVPVCSCKKNDMTRGFHLRQDDCVSPDDHEAFKRVCDHARDNNQLTSNMNYDVNTFGIELTGIGYPILDSIAHVNSPLFGAEIVVYTPYSAMLADDFDTLEWRHMLDPVDRYLSGSFMISKYTHKISSSGEFTTTVNLYRAPVDVKSSNNEPLKNMEQ